MKKYSGIISSLFLIALSNHQTFAQANTELSNLISITKVNHSLVPKLITVKI